MVHRPRPLFEFPEAQNSFHGVEPITDESIVRYIQICFA